MCRFFSGIVTKKSIVWDLDIDSHEDLLAKAGIKDIKTDPNFVRVELVPTDNDVFNHDIKNWKLHVDQDFKPDWFDADDAEKKMRKLIGSCFAERFIKRKIKKITTGRWFLGTGGTIQYVSGGTIQYVRGGTIQYVRGGTIQYVSGGTIQYVSGGTIQYVRGGTIQYVSGGTIQYVSGGTIQYVSGGTIQRVNFQWPGKIEKITENGIVIFDDGNAKRIVVADPKIKIEMFK